MPITGGAATQLTFTTSPDSALADQYPSWSPDGQWIIFDRVISYPGEHHSYKVKANQVFQQDTLTIAVYKAPGNTNAATPAYSPDNKIVTLGKGTYTGVPDIRTYTLDPALATPIPILNYPDVAAAVQGPDPVLSPRISPDGTRTALVSSQLWAARRNMNLPPMFTTVVASPCAPPTVVDSTAAVSIEIALNQLNTIVVSASDPESDPLTFSAYFLSPGTPGCGDDMSFNPSTRTFSWFPKSTPQCYTPPGDYYVKFQVTTSSGGTDNIIAILTARTGCSGLANASWTEAAAGAPIIPEGPNPMLGRFALNAPQIPGATARLAIFDITGHRVAGIMGGRSSSQIVWDGRDAAGRLTSPGIYFYRLEVGAYRRDGKVVVLR